MAKNPNPQGKANLTLLNDLQALRHVEVPAKTLRHVMIDYLTGLLVLSAEFSFRPVPGQVYHLYFRQGRWQLSLIGPGEWRHSRHDTHVAQCELRHDATWAVQPAAGLEARTDVVTGLEALWSAFQARVVSTPTVSDSLPHHESALPYYRRVLASGLARSLQHSLERLGLQHAGGSGLLHALQSHSKTDPHRLEAFPSGDLP